ncbi:MAG: ADP-ribosylation factor family protein [Promethearchaeota archaeon]
MADEKINVKLFIFGLDQAGKTTIVERLKEKKFVPQQPTLGVNITQIVLDRVKFSVVDVGGQKHLRDGWADQIQNPHVLVFVVDGADSDDRLAEARGELLKILSLDKTGDIPLLVLQNKTDLEGSRSIRDIEDAIGWREVEDRDKNLVQVSAKTGDNIPRALNWITSAALRDEEIDVFVDLEVERKVGLLRAKYRELVEKAKSSKKRDDPKGELDALEGALDIAEKFYELGVYGGLKAIRKTRRRANKLRKKFQKPPIPQKAIPSLPKREIPDRKKPDFGKK